MKVRGAKFKETGRAKQRIAGACNALLRMVVVADTLVPFQRLLDRHMDKLGIEGYELRAGR